MPTRTRTSRDRDIEPDEDERPSRRRSRDTDEEEPRARRGRARDPEPEEDERPSRRRSRDSDEEDEKPARRGRGRRSDSDDGDEGGKRGRGRSGRATAGASSYRQKRQVNSAFADEFKPGNENGPVLIKFLDEEFFDSYNQHWIDELKKKSYFCYDDEYYEDHKEKGCPLCDIGDSPRTYTLINVLNLSNPRKPQVQVWRNAVTVSDIIDRLSENKKTAPINRDDLYFEVESVKGSGKNGKWTTTIQPVKERDLEEDFDMEPLTSDEIDKYMEDRFTDRSAISVVETWDDLDEIAAELD